MSSGKLIIGSVFVAAALASALPLFLNSQKTNATSTLTANEARASSTRSLTTGPAADVLGLVNGQTVKRSELSTQDLQGLYDAQNQLYQAIEGVLARKYIESVIDSYMKEKKLPNLQIAEQAFVQEKVIVTEQEIQDFIKQNADNPQLKGKPFAEQKSLVLPYLQQQAATTYFRNLVNEAIANKTIQISLMAKPQPPRISLNIQGAPAKGPENAPITIVEFADFQCPFCAKALPVIENVLKDYPGKIRFVFKNYPLAQIHPQATNAAIAADCAQKEGKYWSMHDALFAHHAELSDDLYPRLAKEIGLDTQKFSQCLKDPKNQEKVFEDMNYGQSLGISATPAFYINGVQLMGAVPLSDFKKAIDAELEALKK